MVDQRDVLALLVCQEGHGPEGQEDAERHSPQTEKSPNCKREGEGTYRRASAAFPTGRHIPLPLPLARLAMGKVLELFYMAQIWQSGRMRKVHSWHRSVLYEQKGPIVGESILG